VRRDEARAKEEAKLGITLLLVTAAAGLLPTHRCGGRRGATGSLEYAHHASLSRQDRGAYFVVVPASWGGNA